MTALLAAVWLLLDYPWGLLAFVAIAALAARPARRRNTRRQVLSRAKCRFRNLATDGLARWQIGVPTTRSP